MTNGNGKGCPECIRSSIASLVYWWYLTVQPNAICQCSRYAAWKMDRLDVGNVLSNARKNWDNKSNTVKLAPRDLQIPNALHRCALSICYRSSV
jgi:hypothetical protein